MESCEVKVIPMTKQTIIETIELTKIYGTNEARVCALDKVNMQIEENEFVAIMGPSGSGKSTLMNLLGCLDRPTSGQYILAGEDVSNLNKSQLALIRNRRIGFIFQSFNLLPRTSALENVVLPILYHHQGKLTDKEQREKSMAVLTEVGLADRADHQPQQLSGGQMQRVAIARALINEPVLILADEPTGNLDSKSSHEIMTILHKLHERGRTIVMVTHEDDIANHAQRIIHFRDGQIERDWSKDHHRKDVALEPTAEDLRYEESK